MSYIAYPDLTKDDCRAPERPVSARSQRPTQNAPMHEWLPGAIFLGCYAAFLLTCLAEWWLIK